MLLTKAALTENDFDLGVLKFKLIAKIDPMFLPKIN